MFKSNQETLFYYASQNHSEEKLLRPSWGKMGGAQPQTVILLSAACSYMWVCLMQRGNIFNKYSIKDSTMDTTQLISHVLCLN